MTLLMRACAIIPAYEAERHIGAITREMVDIWPIKHAVIVVDDGSHDKTAQLAKEAGAIVLRHRDNCGKGAALQTAMIYAFGAGFEVAVSLDADGQHPPSEALRMLQAEPDPEALVLGVRDLFAAGAPRANQVSNQISNFFLSLFTGYPFADTQCGLRRYPLRRTLELGGRDPGYAFEAEILLRAIAGHVRLVELPVRVLYPPENARVTHFDSVRDPARIVVRVVKTLALTYGLRKLPTDIKLEKVTPPTETAAPSRSSDQAPVAHP